MPPELPSKPPPAPAAAFTVNCRQATGRLSFANPATAPKSHTSTHHSPHHTNSACSPIHYSDMHGPNGCNADRKPNSASTPSNPTSWNCGAMAGTPNASANSAGTTNMPPAPSCKSPPMATTPKQAANGIESAMGHRLTASSSPHPSQRTVLLPRLHTLRTTILLPMDRRSQKTRSPNRRTRL